MNCYRRVQLLSIFGILVLLAGGCAGPATYSMAPGNEPGPSQVAEAKVSPTAMVDLGKPIEVTVPPEDKYPGAYYVIEVSLGNGELVAAKDPYGEVMLHTSYFDLESNLDLVDSITAQSPGYLVAFNNGQTLAVDSFEGSLDYEGEFGQTQLSLDTITGFHTVKAQYRHEIRDDCTVERYQSIELSFPDGLSQRACVGDGVLDLQVMYGELLSRIFVNRAPAEYDWEANTVRISHPAVGSLQLSTVTVPDRPQESRNEIQTNYGRLSFAWQSLVSSKPVGTLQPFNPAHSVSFVDGTRLPVNLKWTSCPSGGYDCLRLDGNRVDSLNLDQVQSITAGATPGSGTISYIMGGERSFEAGELILDWALGELELPLSASVFEEIVRAEGGTPPPAGAFKLLIRLPNGEEMQADLESVNQRITTAVGDDPAVLHLIEFAVPMGMWLVDKGFLEADNVGGQLHVLMFGEAYPIGPAADLKLDLTNVYGRLSLGMDEIASVRPIPSGDQPRETFNVRLITRDGNTYTFPAEKVQFVRYPDRIWDGTAYELSLGAWYWRRFDAIKVRSGSSRIDVDLARVQRLTLSGDYPAWDIEVQSSEGGEILRGQVVTAQVALESPGIASWNSGREGFWFAWQSEHAFLFVPAGNVAAIEIDQ